MSRIGNKVIQIPAGVSIVENNRVLTVKGDKGEDKYTIPHGINFTLSATELHFSRENDSKTLRELHGTTRANVHNIVVGVSEGFSKTLEIVGIGYRAAMQGTNVVLHVGYSHDIIINPEVGSEITCKSPTEIIVSGTRRQAVGQTAARIREVRPPEPYNGKGIKYKGEFILRKEGKRTGKK